MDLVQKVQAGDLGAFRELVAQHQRYIYTIVYRIVGTKEDAEEVSQDVFVKVYKNIAGFNHESKLTSWLYSIAFRTAIDHKRKMARYTTNNINIMDRNIDFSTQGSQISNLVSENRKQYINEALSKLKEDEATIISLFYLKEFSIKEISEITMISLSNIKVKLFRARKNLRSRLEHVLDKEINMI